MKKLLLLAFACLGSMGANAQTWEWTGETPVNGSTEAYYLYSSNQKRFLNDNNGLDVTPTVTWTIGTSNGSGFPGKTDGSSGFSLTSNNSKQFAMYRINNSNKVETNATGKSGSDINLCSAKSEEFGEFYSICRSSKNDNWSGNRNIGSNANGIEITKDAVYEWLFVAQSSVDDYNTYYPTYKAAYDAVKAYDGNSLLSSGLKDKVTNALTTYETANVGNVTSHTSFLNQVATYCQNYISTLNLGSATAENPVDLTCLINNPTIVQDGANNQMPNGWIAFAHGSGNGTYTLGTGDTKLECWHGTASEFNVDYYQTLTNLPAGHYVLSADMHFRGSENCVGVYVYNASTNSTVYTLVNENSETDRTYSVGFDVETCQSVNIGVKKIGENTVDNAWMTADNFTLKYQGLSMGSPITMPTTWINASGKWNTDYDERFGGNDNDYPVGNVLYQSMTNMAQGYYRVEFFASARAAQWGAGNVRYGEGIAKVFVNDIDEDLIVVNSKSIEDVNDASLNHSIIAYVGADGNLTYGIKNVAAGGNWYVCKTKSLTFLGPDQANLTVTEGKYGTFVAPYDVVLPDGVTAYNASYNSEENGIELTSTGSQTVAANTPVIVAGTACNENFYGVAPSNATATNGVLTGLLQAGTVPADSYVLQTQGGVQKFYKVASAATGKKNRCFVTVSAPSKVLTFTVDGEETSIETPLYEETGNKDIYDLSGRKVNNAQKGIYIVNGRKVLVK